MSNQKGLNFQTIPGRQKTKKWTTAPSYNYDGDEWGGYDEWEEPPPPPMPAQASYGTQQLPSQQQQPALTRGRNTSFDHGDERRHFSASTPTSALPAHEERRPSRGPASALSTGRGSNDMPRSRSRPRDFTNPEQAPPPLVTRATPGSPAPNEWFPPRKSSLKGGTYETAAAAAEARAIAESVAQLSTPSTDKPLPFIRPSDIYKRIPEEMRRQSQEGSRPSMDSLQRELSPSHPILTPVAEARESRLFADVDVPGVDDKSSNAVGAQSQGGAYVLTSTPKARDTSPTLPQLNRFSGFGDDFLSGRGTAQNVNSIPNATESTAAASPPGDLQGSNTTSLQHQPSAGFRSAVHLAFDRSDESPSVSRDGSRSGPGGNGVSRSDTTSTAGISPIMSNVPSAGAAQLGQQPRLDEQVPSIAEEPSITPASSIMVPGAPAAQFVPRKPSPGHSRNVSGEMPAEFTPGYRRSLDPPSSGTSPARTPALETTAMRRLSSPMSAVHMTDPEAPDVTDQGAEVPEPTLYPAETPASEVGELTGTNTLSKPLPITGRSRSGTDYSVREADIANTVNSSPDKGVSSPSIAEAQRESQKQFLEMHHTPTSEFNSAGREAFRSQTGTPTYGSRAGSPTKGRVREIAENINSASRRNSATSMHSSKSSWSQFDKPTLTRQGTAQSQTGNESAPVRPGLDREESFKPDLPGGWVSSAPTPALESPPTQPSPSIARDATPQPETPIDLTPTTKKYQLQSGPVATAAADTNESAFEAVKSVGEQLGASLLSTVGIGHQTRDFASSEPAAPVEQPEMQARAATGELSVPPPMMRLQSDSDAATSVASSVAPTPPAMDTSKGDMLSVTDGHAGYFNTVAPLRIRSREASPEHSQPAGQAPLLSTMSTDSHTGDVDDERLRKEIVRSLDPMAAHETSRASIDDMARMQDALDIPANERRVEQGMPTAPTAEAAAARPGLLDTRFSWENSKSTTSNNQARTAVPAPPSPEIKPEAAYERPRGNVLHVVNAAVSPESPQDNGSTMRNMSLDETGLKSAIPLSATDSNSLISPVTRSQEHLVPDSSLQPGGPAHSLVEIAPSPISDRAESISTRLPSYYLGDHEPVVLDAPEKDHTNSSTLSQPALHEQAKASAPIPPFRNILNMKTSEERINTYNATRQTFAEMNTGLSDWLAQMLEHHPEHTDLSVAGSKPPPLQTQMSNFKRGHKPSPSIAKFTDQFRSTSGQRTATMASNDGEGAARPTTAGAGAGADSSRIDMDRMQQQMKQSGKEFMKNASVFGGKASSGAKGLFAKGKSRFAGGSVKGKPNSNYEAPIISPPVLKSGPGDPTSNARSLTSPVTPVTAIPIAATTTESMPSVLAASGPATVSKSSTAPVNEIQTPITAIPISVLDDNVAKNSPPLASVPSDAPGALINEILEANIESPLNDITNITTVPTSAALASAPSNVPQSSETSAVPTLPLDNSSHGAAEKNTRSDAPSLVTARSHAIPAGTNSPTTSAAAVAPPSESRETHTGSPSRRARSQTPSSSRPSSRPLSQVFERLREKTRSVSRSTTTSERRKPESSRSRPASMVLATPDLPPSISSTTLPPGDQQGEFNVMAVRSTQRGIDNWEGERPPHRRSSTAPNIPANGRRAMSMAMPLRTEVWNEPDAELPPKTPEARNGSGAEARLGVLPSPAPTLLTFEDAGMSRRASLEVAKRRESNAPIGGWKDSWGGEQLGTVESRGESVEEDESGTKESNTRQLADDKQKAAEQNPMPIRRGSDLATLPSQQASRPSTAAAGKQRPQTAWLREEDEDEDEDARPTESSRPQGRYFIANAVPKDEQVSGSPSPVWEQPQQHQRRISDLALLPSQQQYSPLNVGRPDSQILVPLRLPSDESVRVEEASPVTIKQTSPTVLSTSDWVIPIAAKIKDEDDLYDTTPVASKTPWNVANTGHEADIKQMEEEIGKAAAVGGAEQLRSQAPVSLPPAPDVSRPTTSGQLEDARSEISADEGVAEEGVRNESTMPHRTLSRHSSVSSLEDLDDTERFMLAPGTAEPTLMADEARRLVMSAQAVPAGPSPEEVKQIEQQTQKQRFANRSYADRTPQMRDRPLSYAPVPRDPRGVVREEITTGAENNLNPVSPVQVDIAGMSGTPTTKSPFQQHPMFRGQNPQQAVQQSEYERLRHSVANPSHTPQASIDATTEKRRSGFFRSRKNTVETRVPSGATPTASRIDDNHGLEDLQIFGPVAGQSERVEAQPRTEAEQRQARRGSGIWNTLTRRSSRGGARPDSSRSSSAAPLEPQNNRPVSRSQLDKVREEPSRPKTLRKPQRTPSDSGELETKKKRFSRLGSLFGRSNTTAAPESSSSRGEKASPLSNKTNRLSKRAPKEDNGVRRSETVQEHRPENFGTVTGSVRGYEAYEAMRRRDMPAFQENQGNRTQRRPGTGPATPQPPGIEPPADGWYGPSSREAEEPQQIQPTTSPVPLPEFRRLHTSGGPRQHGPVNDVPEAFRPVQASFDGPVAPIGPPPGHEPPYIQSAQGPVAHRIPKGAPMAERNRQMSHGSDVSQLSRQVSGQLGSVSPMQQTAFPPPRSPMPSDPHGGRQQASQGFEEQRSRVASWSEGPETYSPPRSRMAPPGYANPQPPQPYQQQLQFMGRRPSQGPSRPAPQGSPGHLQQGPPRAIPWEDVQPIRSPPPPPNQQQGPFPGPPRSFTAPADTAYGYSPEHQQRSPQHVYYQQQQQQRVPPPSMTRYYAHPQQHHPGPPRRTSSGPAPQDPFAAHQQQRPPNLGHHKRRSSGYTGRRDDPTVGEEDLIMRGVSYPGQEWAPAPGAHQSWD